MPAPPRQAHTTQGQAEREDANPAGAEPAARHVTDTFIPARPTVYNGIRMRSRLEADYAAHLDRSGFRWAYEPECFASGAGQWLPDFGTTLADDGPFRIFTELKPAGPLRRWISNSLGYVEHVDGFLRRIAVAWASRPDAELEVVFWDYGADGPYLRVTAMRTGGPWWAETDDSNLFLLWPGMGQYERLKADS